MANELLGRPHSCVVRIQMLGFHFLSLDSRSDNQTLGFELAE
jgi:hypothetical protein